MFLTSDVFSYIIQSSPKKKEIPSNLDENTKLALIQSYQNIGRECKENIIFDSVLFKYSPGLNHQNYFEKYCCVNQRGFFVYKSRLTAYKIDTKPLLIIPFAIIKEIKWVEVENSTKRKKYEDKWDHLYSF